ncbi:MAG TPA: SIS domain-containing protein [Actinomycetes bacterium]|nr:SIS domain-containing protein [Actinomycetes bacterium]
MDVDAYLAGSAAAAAGLAEQPGAAAVEKAAGLLAGALAGGGQVLFCGNGGSAADAQHLAAELVGHLGLGLARPGYRAVALTTDTSALTAIGNDFGFELLFERQVEALGRRGDVLVALSTSGRSANVVRAAVAARERGLGVVAMLGPSASEIDALADVVLRVPGEVPGIVQQGHITVGHALCAEVEHRLSAPGPGYPVSREK